MSTDNRAQNDMELEDLLARRSPLSRDYANMVRAEPAADLDARILSAARSAAATPAAVSTPVAGKVASVAPAKVPTASRNIPKPPAARTPVAVDDDDDEDDEPTPATRPRWMVPAALAASLVVAVGIGFTLLSDNGTEQGATAQTGSTLAKRTRKPGDAAKAADAVSEAATDTDAEVVVLNAERPSERPVLPPPPFFAPEMPQVEDLDAAIAMIRKELVVANQKAAMRAEMPAASALAAAPARGEADKQTEAPAGIQADAATSEVVIQPRDRRLAKILELYDNGNPELAADSLEIFLRDFADDPITQQILARKP
ncbi:MAG: hypothetical protein R3F24_01515 [Gammaproteobacteria bacterium]